MGRLLARRRATPPPGDYWQSHLLVPIIAMRDDTGAYI